MHKQCVPGLSLGGEGPGDKVKMQVREQYHGTSIFALVSIMPQTPFRKIKRVWAWDYPCSTLQDVG